MKITGTLLGHFRSKDAWGVGDLYVESAEPAEAARAGEEIRVVSPQLGQAAPGEVLVLEGEWDDGKWGRQFKAARQHSLGIQSDAEAHRWLTRLDGIGPVLARRVFDHFSGQQGVLAVLAEEPDECDEDPLAEVSGISASKAALIRESWAEVGLAANAEDLSYLDGLKLTRYEANTVLEFAKKRGKKPRQLLEAEPYSLTRANGFGFKRTDSVALRAGMDRMAPARADAAVRHMAAELCQADTMVSLRELIKETVELIGQDGPSVHAAVDRASATGELVQTEDEGGRRWIHPAGLLGAERLIYRLLREAGQVEDHEQQELAQVVSAACARADAANGGAPVFESTPGPPNPLLKLLDMIDDDATEEDW